MGKPRSFRHVIYALVSIACPIVAFVAIDLYQTTRNGAFWQSLTPGDDASNNAGGMMAIAEFAELLFALFTGCLVGLVFAILSLRSRRRILSFGTAALIFNGLPFLLLVMFAIRAYVKGF